MNTDLVSDGAIKLNTDLVDAKEIKTSLPLLVPEMTCLSCIYQIKDSLRPLPGISIVKADLDTRIVTIEYNPNLITPEDFTWAMKEKGYETESAEFDEAKEEPEESAYNETSPKIYLSIIIGLAASLTVFGIYLGLMALTSSWINAKSLFAANQWWIIALAVGLGVQAGLYSFIRRRLAQARGSAKKGLAASGGLSSASMAACCSHYLVAVLPAIGLPFLSSAVATIELLQTPLFMIGVVSNLIGIAIMLRIMVHNGIISNVILTKLFNFRVRQVAV